MIQLSTDGAYDIGTLIDLVFHQTGGVTIFALGDCDMQQIALSEVADDAAMVPADVLRALGVSNGDKVAFVRNDDGSISLTKAPTPTTKVKRSISDFIGIFATGEQRSLEQALALLREIRYGDEDPPSRVFGDNDIGARDINADRP